MNMTTQPVDEQFSDQDLLQALMHKSEDAIYFKDRNSRFIRCSAALARLIGVQDAKELIGKCDGDFFTSEHAQDALADEQAIIRTGEPIIGKAEKETWPDGHVTWCLTSKMPFYNARGYIAGTFGISKNITAMKKAEEKIAQMNQQLIDVSRRAGMAEVATSVLHNVGNVLNSVNVSGSLIAGKVRNSKVSNLAKAAALIQAHEKDLAEFFGADPKGRQLPAYLSNLASHLVQEQEEVLQETEALIKNIMHIMEIVSMQQSYAKVSGVRETLKIADLVEDALRMNIDSMDRHRVKVSREFAEVPPLMVEKHKVLQILVNLINNAKHACDDSQKQDKHIILAVANGAGRVKVSVTDNGVGISTENQTRIFAHGFTTRKGGHGFGLHSGALAAKEMGGNLTAFSEGPGRGATFTLELPVQP